MVSLLLFSSLHDYLQLRYQFFHSNLWLLKFFLPGFPQPHKFAESFCCNTMPEEIIAGNLNWASD